MTAPKNNLEVLEMIMQAIENDARNFDGRPFNCRTAAEYFGSHGAAIAALARILKATIEGLKELKDER